MLYGHEREGERRRNHEEDKEEEKKKRDHSAQKEHLTTLPIKVDNNIVSKAKSKLPEREKEKGTPIYDFLKRSFDIVASLAASIVLFIPTLITAIIITIKDPGNPFYFHTRVGRNRKPIKILKLRSMKKNADRLEEMLTQEQIEEYKREYKIEDDPRLIGWKKPGDGRRCFGAKMRQWSIDEIPQIFYNILIKNDLSIVGPRPILEEEMEKYYSPEQQKKLLSVKPGLTGFWQAYARNEAKYERGG